MKKIYSVLFLIGIIAFGTIAFSYLSTGKWEWDEPVENFKDLRGSEWYSKAANFALDHDYIKGIDGNFDASTNVNRAQIAQMLEKFATNVKFIDGPRVFTDGWFGFKLTFPDSWRGYLYEYSNYTSSDLNKGHPITQYHFGVLTKEGVFEDLLDLDVWERPVWDNVMNASEGPVGAVLGENSSYVIEALPVQTGTSENAPLRKDVTKIMDSFAWSNPE